MVVVLPASMWAMMPMLRIDRRSECEGSLPMVTSSLIRTGAGSLLIRGCRGPGPTLIGTELDTSSLTPTAPGYSASRGRGRLDQRRTPGKTMLGIVDSIYRVARPDPLRRDNPCRVSACRGCRAACRWWLPRHLTLR